MADKYKLLLALLCGSVLTLVGGARLFDEFLQARRFVQYGVEKQATILELDHIIGGKDPRYVYSLRIDRTLVLKTLPYNWTLPIERSFLVLSQSPRADDLALGNRHSGALIVMCYMQGCDKPLNLLLYPLLFIVCVIVVPVYWIRLIRNWQTS